MPYLNIIFEQNNEFYSARINVGFPDKADEILGPSDSFTDILQSIKSAYRYNLAETDLNAGQIKSNETLYSVIRSLETGKDYLLFAHILGDDEFIGLNSKMLDFKISHEPLSLRYSLYDPILPGGGIELKLAELSASHAFAP